MNIITSKLGELFVISLRANAKIYGMGDSKRIAIGNMLRVHQQLLNIRITDQAKAKKPSFWQSLISRIWSEKKQTEIIFAKKEKQISIWFTNNPKATAYGTSIDDALGSLIMDNGLNIAFDPRRVKKDKINYFASFKPKVLAK